LAKGNQSTTSSKALVAAHLVSWYFNGLKTVSDNFLGTATELGRETRPKREYVEHLQAVGILISDFSRWFQPELFDYPGLPENWANVLVVARECESHLIEQFRQLAELEASDDESNYKDRFERASTVLIPFAQQLRAALLAI
jgi:hypothetical protein